MQDGDQMRTACVFAIFAAVFALSGVALAQGCGVVGGGPPPCMPACPPVPQPANIGAGPAAGLNCLSGCDFDQNYISAMYQQHNTIATLAYAGMTRVSDEDIQALSRKIRDEQLDLNNKLAQYAAKAGICLPALPGGQGPSIVASLCGMDQCNFSMTYAATMIELLQQSKDAADIARARSNIPEVRYQAGIVSKSADNEIAAIGAWEQTVVVACTPTCVSRNPVGCGPTCNPGYPLYQPGL